MDKPFEYVYHQGNMVPYAEATIHVFTPAVKYGIAVFEGIRAYWNDERKELFVFRLEDHARRLLQSLKLMRLNVSWTMADVVQPVLDVLTTNRVQTDVHIRQLVYAVGDGLYSTPGPVEMSVVAIEKGRPRGFESGITCGISSWTRIADNVMPPRIKCCANYQNSRLATLDVKRSGADQPLFLNDRGKLSEGPGFAVMLVRGNTLVAPSVTSDILESITRETVIHLWKNEMGLPVEERDVDRTELYVCDEAFICGTANEVVPVISVDGLSVGQGVPGELTRKLQQLYLEIARGRMDRHSEWLYPVYGSAAHREVAPDA